MRSPIPYLMALPFLAMTVGAGLGQQSYPANLSPAEAHRMVTEKKAVLIDIRTPEEWRETGVAEGAHLIDMTDPMFAAKLNRVINSDRSRPIALICRTANRTRVVQQGLQQQGFPHVINVEGGMVGNRADPGWIKAGLPMAKCEPGKDCATAPKP